MTRWKKKQRNHIWRDEIKKVNCGFFEKKKCDKKVQLKRKKVTLCTNWEKKGQKKPQMRNKNVPFCSKWKEKRWIVHSRNPSLCNETNTMCMVEAMKGRGFFNYPTDFLIIRANLLLLFFSFDATYHLFFSHLVQLITFFCLILCTM